MGLPRRAASGIRCNRWPDFVLFALCFSLAAVWMVEGGTVTPDVQVVAIGDNATFTCTATVTNSTSFTVTWTTTAPSMEVLASTEELAVDGVSLTSTLALTSVDIENGGFYTCAVSDSNTAETSGFDQEALLYVRPRVIPEFVNARNGDTNVTLMCDPQADPQPLQYQWQRVGEPSVEEDFFIAGSGSGMLLRSLVLEFDPIEFGDEGVYQCMVSIPQMSEFISSSSNVTVSVSPEGSVLVSPLDQMFDNGDNVTLNCTAQGGPNNEFRWSRNGSNLGSEDQLVLTQSDFGGEYTCFVSNAAGEDNATTTVFVAPEITSQPMALTNASAGDSAVLTCEAEGFPEVEFDWMRVDSQTLGNNTSGANSSTLVFDPVRFGDEGAYFCTATSGNNTVQSNDAILAVSPNGSVAISPALLTAEFQANVTFTCSALGGPNNQVQWQFNGTEIDNETSLELVLSTVDSRDGGEYTCAVSNSAGSSDQTATLFIRPYFVAASSDTQTSDGSNGTLTCMADGFPAPTVYTWMTSASSNLNSSSITGVDSPTLTFTPVQFGDEGNYTCLVISDSGSISSTVILTVSPLARIDPLVQSAEFADSVTFTCSAQGGPGNEFQWQRNGWDLQNETLANLTVANISASEGGSYTCVVSNAAGNDSETATLYVQPYIETQPGDVLTTNGSEVNFTFEAESFPDPEYQWLNNDTGMIIAMNSTLTLSPAEFGDEGVYICTATNPATNGTVESMALLTISPFGSVMVEPETEFAEFGDNVTFTCSAQGGPGNEFQWQRNGWDLQNETLANLTVANISASEGGSYTCVVSNAAGNDSETATLYVQPYIETQPEDVLTTNGSEVNFTCEAESFPDPEYQWMNADSGAIVGNDSVLDFPSADFGDEGRYVCAVTADDNGTLIGNATFSNTVTLHVSPLNSVRVDPVIAIGDLGDSVTFTCSAQGGPGNEFQWQRNGGDFENETLANLTVANISASEGGSYTCVVSNAAGNDSETATLYVEPYIETQPEDVLTTNGSEVHFTFEAESFPDPEYQWLNNDTGMIIAMNSTLTLSPAEFGDEGVYICTATNPATNGTAESMALLTISPFGSVMVEPETKFAEFGDNVTFTCSAQGGPDNEFQWQRNGRDLENETLANLTVANISVSDGGSYTCVVSNAAGNDSETATLYVQPYIETQPEDVLTTNGSEVNFTFEAESFPDPEYQWLNNDTGVIIAMNSTLTLSPAEFGDEGVYICTATNPATNGTVESMALLTISPFGSVMVEPEIEITAEFRDSVTFTCSAQGGPDNEFQWQRNGGDLENETLANLTVANISASEGGSYTCVVSNAAGDDSETATLYVQPYILIQPDDIFATLGSEVNFNCEAESFPDPEYQWMNADTGAIVGNDSVLDFPSADFRDEGRYVCAVTADDNGTLIGDPAFSDIVTLHVSPLSSVMVEPEIEFAEFGDNVTFTCSAQGGPGNEFQWQRNGGDLENETLANLTVANISASEGGSYTCVVSNAAGDDSETATLYVQPYIETQPEDVLTTNGSEVNFTCVAESFPDPEYQWIDLDSGEVVSNMSTLEFGPAIFGSEGPYRCAASAVLDSGSSLETAFTQNVTLTISPLGSIQVGPTIVNSSRGDSVTFTCSAQGGPGNEFQWQRNGGDLENETLANLTVANISASEGGSYTCVVSNAAGDDSATATLYVQPYIETQPEDVLTTNGSEVNFTCEAESFPDPEYQWIDAERTVVGNDSLLVFSPAVFGDEGSYTCRVTVESVNGLIGSITSDAVTLTVSPSGSVLVDPGDTIAARGDSVTFTCSAQGGPGNEFQWQRNGEDLQNETLANLTVANISASERGNYTCVVSNAAGNDSSTASMLYVEPYITAPPEDILAEAGDNASFTCTANGFPAPQYEWIRMSTSLIVETDSILQFSPAIFGAEGFYICRAVTPSISRMVNSTLALLTLSPSSSVQATPIVRNSTTGQTENFTCTAMGGPGNTFSWLRMLDGATVATDPLLTVDVGNASAGDEYVCTVTNAAGNDSATVTLNVSPEFQSQPVDLNVTSFEGNISLSCTASGFPVPSIVWLHNGTAVDDTSERIQIIETSSSRSVSSVLVTTMAMTNDSGDYVCNLESALFPTVPGEPVRVLVQDTPEQPQNVMAVDLTSRNLILTWIEPHDNNAPILGYFIDFQQPPFPSMGAAVTLNTSTESVFIEELHPGVTYNFTVTAFNGIGNSVTSEVHVVTTSEEPPSGPPLNAMATVISSSVIQLEWKPPVERERNGIISNYLIDVTPLNDFNGQINSSMQLNTSSDGTSFNITDLEAFLEYNMRVSAENSAGVGPPSSPDISATTEQDDPTGFPSTVTAVTLSATAILVEWNEVDEIDRNGEITLYQVDYTPNNDIFQSGSVNTTDASTFNLTLDNLQEFVLYNITVTAYTVIGPGPSSAPPAMARTDPAAPSGQPQDVMATVISSSVIQLEWKPPVDTEINGIISNYLIDVTPLNDFNGQINSSMQLNTSSDGTSFNITDLEAFLEYNMTVSAENSAGVGPPSSPDTSATTEQDVPTGSPSTVTAVTLSATAILVEWNEVDEIDRNGEITLYQVDYTPNNAMFESGSVNTTNASTFSLTLENLQEFVLYNITVTAYTVIGPGPPSDPPAMARTNQSEPPAPPPPPPPWQNETGAFNVTLRWFPPADPNGVIEEYVVRLEQIPGSSMARKRREADVDNLESCLQDSSQNISVNGNETSVVVDGLTPFTMYQFAVQARNGAGRGSFSESTPFSTIEDVPSMPTAVSVVSNNSTSLRISWDPPACDNGIRTSYTISYVPVQNDAISVGDPPSGFVVGTSRDVSVIRNLSINSLYNISIFASTSVGPGDVAMETGQTEEDVPNEPVSSLSITSQANSFSNNTVTITISWAGPSDRNGLYNYELQYSALQAPPYPAARSQSEQTDVITLNGDANNIEFVFLGLPFANYTATVEVVNRRRPGLEGPLSVSEERTIAIESTAVTELSAVALTSSTIKVIWSLPDYPNGPVGVYNVFYAETEIVGQSVDFENDPSFQRTSSSFFVVVLQELEPFTSYTIYVQPVALGNLIGEAAMIVLRTNSSAPTELPVTDVAPSSATPNTILFYLPPPSGIGSGNVIFYAVIVINTQLAGFDGSTDLERFDDAGIFVETNTEQAYYITAAWDRPSAVPASILIGNGTTTVAKQTSYLNARLSSGTEYAIVIRVEIMSDNAQMLVAYSEAVVITTAPAPVNAAGVAVGIIIIICLIVAIVLGVVIFICWYKGRIFSKGHFSIEDEIALQDQDPGAVALQPLHIFRNPSIPIHEPVPVEEFGDYVKKMHANDDYPFSEEYASVEPSHSPSAEATHNAANTAKNRYANISAYDHSRVKLQEVEGRAGSDYINGNFLDGYRKPNAFIGTQGPVPDSVPDFWRMVWEQSSATIVMVTNLEEKGRVKCHKYWPSDRTSIYGIIRVTLQETLVIADHTVRTFTLQKEGSKAERTVTQFHFTIWPDHGVPDYPTALLHFVRKVTAHNPVNSGPIVVHCSAGVGRTGTFITLFTQLKRIQIENNIDVFNSVRAMRYNRCCMVQTEPQYVFIHDALLEALECGVTEVAARDLKEQYRKLGEVDEIVGLTGLEIEYEKLKTTIHRNPTAINGGLQINRQKNRFANPDFVPYDITRCRLSFIPGVEGSDYINANFIDGYTKCKEFIATQGPLPDTVDDFWKMIWEHKAATIIMLTKEREGGRMKCHRYWPMTGADTYGQYQVILHAVNEYPDYTLREFKIVDTRDKSSLPVKQFQFTEWPEGGVPDTGSGLIDLLGQVQKWQMNSGSKPIIVHCSSGCGRTGAFIAVSVLLERLKTEAVVDVFHTVRALRLQRPGMVHDVDQYEFCYKTVLEYLDSFELYANFK